jgi:molecular chaperone IbpA
MTTFDFTPLFRNSVGFDRLAALIDSASRADTSANGYPPYNIEALTETNYRITMAVAGFSEDEINIVSEQNILKVSGAKAEDPEDSADRYLHRGIAKRNFERRFQLADYVHVSSAQLENGLLHIELEREIPEAMKPRSIEINSGKRLIEGKKAAKAAA